VPVTVTKAKKQVLLKNKPTPIDSVRWPNAADGEPSSARCAIRSCALPKQ